MLTTRNRIVPWPIVSSGIWRDPNRSDHVADTTWTPAASVVETESAFLLRLEVPGVNPDSIGVDLEGGHLTVRGERAALVSTPGEKVISSEMPSGKFTRSFRVGSGVDRESVAATYRSGILEIEAPKSQDARARRIPVTVTG